MHFKKLNKSQKNQTIRAGDEQQKRIQRILLNIE